MNNEIDRKYYSRLDKESLIDIVLSYDKTLTKIGNEISKDKMEQFDDYVIYLLEKYEGILMDNNYEDWEEVKEDASNS